ncbi:MAG TPA: outer membrane protein assembly factor BamB, partial [Nevskiaceae bacterium]|nr:outer membrane protein assembly factor BamB [Nevskiaceae bacterium]
LKPGNGDRIWRARTRARIVSGPGVFGSMVLVGTLDAEVIALNRADGKELWRSKVSSEVMAAPVGDGHVVVARTGDGQVHGLAADSGQALWHFDRTEPNLTLRGLSDPLIVGNRVYVGMDNGRVVALSLDSGQLLWEQAVSVQTGRTELDRLTDIDGSMLPSGNSVYAVSFGGELAALDDDNGEVTWRRSVKSYNGLAQSGDLVLTTDHNGVVWALDAASGAAVWKQEGLQYRKLSPPAAFAGYVVVGDYQGYLHWLDPKDGKVVGRSRAGSDPIRAAPIASDKLLYVLNTGGKLSAITVR